MFKKHPDGRGEDSRAASLIFSYPETPPRAWGRHCPPRYAGPSCGNTPTGVGKTARDKTQINRKRKHPHGRGEDLMAILLTHDILETPPRAWGRLRRIQVIRYHAGNTPTGVGKTCRLFLPLPACKKHPHGRGEEVSVASEPSSFKETPPRAWGRAVSGERDCGQRGNTPTGVGKRSGSGINCTSGWKHPHGRGEEGRPFIKIPLAKETPPRAWGRGQHLMPRARRFGNTPTGVGKSAKNKTFARFLRKHPHGRGEEEPSALPFVRLSETPPRAWGRVQAL